MTDDEIRAYLKPNHSKGWGWVGAAVGVASLAYSVAAHFAVTPTREEFTQARNDSTQIRLDQAVMKGTQERQGMDIQDIKVDLKALRESLDKSIKSRR